MKDDERERERGDEMGHLLGGGDGERWEKREERRMEEKNIKSRLLKNLPKISLPKEKSIEKKSRKFQNPRPISSVKYFN